MPSDNEIQAVTKWSDNCRTTQAVDKHGKVLAKVSISLETIAGQDFITYHGKAAAEEEVERSAKDMVLRLANQGARAGTAGS